MRNKKSFTVIELLVVIAIIGLLSSIVLVSFNLPAQKQKARIAKSLEFSQSTQNALGSEGVGTWSLDNNLLDSSGYANNGAIFGSASFINDTPYEAVGTGAGKYSLNFNGGYVEIADSGSNFTGDKTQALTIEAWIKPISITGSQNIVSKDIPNYSPRWIVDLSSSKIRFVRSLGIEVYSNNTINANVWTHVAVSWIPGIVNIYINGNLDKSASVTTDTASPEPGWLHVGKLSDHNGWSNSFNGLIDEVRIYAKVFNQAQIKKHYAKGLERSSE